MTSLTQRDAHANKLLNAFDFRQAPSASYVIPLNQFQIDVITPYIFSGGQWTPNPHGGSTTLAFLNNDLD